MRMKGRTEKASNASRQLMVSMRAAMMARLRKSSTMASTPAVNISLMASTSEVMRVTRRPTAWVSKKPMCMRCMWRKISRRRSKISFWPVHCMRYIWTNSKR